MESLEIVVLTDEQEKAIEQAFKVDLLKDTLALNKMFDFDFDDVEDN